MSTEIVVEKESLSSGRSSCIQKRRRIAEIRFLYNLLLKLQEICLISRKLILIFFFKFVNLCMI